MSVIHKNGTTISTQKEDKSHASFSLRIPADLARQIDDRCAISKRSRNKEIEVMLERQIESEVERDRILMEKINKMNVSPGSSQS